MMHTSEVISGFAFGEHKRKHLFMRGSTSIYSMYVNAVGAPMVPPQAFVRRKWEFV